MRAHIPALVLFLVSACGANRLGLAVVFDGPVLRSEIGSLPEYEAEPTRPS